MSLRIDKRRVRYFMNRSEIDTQLELAQKAGLDKYTISRLLDGGTFTSGTVEKLATALRCNPIDLLEADGYPAPHVDAQAFATIPA